LTEELVLRAVEPGDLDAFFEYQRDPEAVGMAAVPPRDRPAFDEHWRRILADPGTVVRTIAVDGRVAGNAVSWPDGERRLVGYWIGREHWGRGIATRALRAFVAERSERPLHALVAGSNRPSIRVLEKCGFVAVGEPVVGEDGVEELCYELGQGT
jgi:RimJ/RimL family protein N-acetyltransferase